MIFGIKCIFIVLCFHELIVFYCIMSIQLSWSAIKTYVINKDFFLAYCQRSSGNSQGECSNVILQTLSKSYDPHIYIRRFCFIGRAEVSTRMLYTELRYILILYNKFYQQVLILYLSYIMPTYCDHSLISTL